MDLGLCVVEPTASRPATPRGSSGVRPTCPLQLHPHPLPTPLTQPPTHPINTTQHTKLTDTLPTAGTKTRSQSKRARNTPCRSCYTYIHIRAITALLSHSIHSIHTLHPTPYTLRPTPVLTTSHLSKCAPTLYPLIPPPPAAPPKACYTLLYPSLFVIDVRLSGAWCLVARCQLLTFARWVRCALLVSVLCTAARDGSYLFCGARCRVLARRS